MPALRCIEPAFISVIKRQWRDLISMFSFKKSQTEEEAKAVEEAED